MMRTSRKLQLIVVFAILALLKATVFSTVAFANSAEPPGVTVIVAHAPDDLTLSIRFNGDNPLEAIPLYRENKAWESYYRFFYRAEPRLRESLDDAVLVIQSAEHHFEYPLPILALNRYNNLVTLNLADETIVIGRPIVREWLLISLRVTLTLFIEGLIFFALAYRSKRSWITFLVVNLITQGGLNMILSGPNIGSYWLIGLIFLEVPIFMIEILTFAFVLKEHRKRRAVAYAFLANAASLLVGGLLLAYLPI